MREVAEVTWCSGTDHSVKTTCGWTTGKVLKCDIRVPDNIPAMHDNALLPLSRRSWNVRVKKFPKPSKNLWKLKPELTHSEHSLSHRFLFCFRSPLLHYCEFLWLFILVLLVNEWWTFGWPSWVPLNASPFPPRPYDPVHNPTHCFFWQWRWTKTAACWCHCGHWCPSSGCRQRWRCGSVAACFHTACLACSPPSCPACTEAGSASRPTWEDWTQEDIFTCS